MPRPTRIEMSARSRCASLAKTTCASMAVRKYLPRIASRLVSTWPRRAPPTSTCLPVTVRCIARLTLPAGALPPAAKRGNAGRSGQAETRRPSRRERLFAAALHRGRDAHHVAILRHRAPGDVDALLLQQFDDALVGQRFAGRLAVDHALDAEAHRLGRMRVAAVGRRDRGSEEILQ